ncbi:MAG: PHP domain-containing protein [Nitrospirota bacterium]
MWHIDCHVHTEYSSDGVVTVEKVIDICEKKGLHGIAITDHNTIEGALKLKDMVQNSIFIIIGEEVKTTEGEITGLFLNKRILSGLSPEETVNRIKQQGGLVCIPHPFCRFRKSKLSFDALKRIINKVDLIEVYNSRNILEMDNKSAYQFALNNKKAMVAGSDAHLGYEYGMSYIKISSFSNAEEFRNNLTSVELVTRRSPLLVHLFTKIKKVIQV